MTHKDDDLDVFFDASRKTARIPSQALMARVLADAQATQAGHAPVPQRKQASSYWQDFLRAIGGWPAMAGLATATVAGVWLGVSPPGVLPEATQTYFGTSGVVIDADIGLGLDLTEGAS